MQMWLSQWANVLSDVQSKLVAVSESSDKQRWKIKSVNVSMMSFSLKTGKYGEHVLCVLFVTWMQHNLACILKKIVIM